MIDEKLFAILIWALLCATITAPPLFAKTLNTHIKRLEKEMEDTANELEAEGGAEGKAHRDSIIGSDTQVNVGAKNVGGYTC